MASATFEGGKHTTKQACSGNIKHDYRERENYDNKDIDGSLTYLNQHFGCETGDEARKKLRQRIADCDSEHPPKRIRADRKTSLEICIPAPREGLDFDKTREFFSEAYKSLEVLFGKENVIYGVSHFDEVHEYIDARDNKTHTSRAGLHVVVIPWTDDAPFVDDKHKTGLNMNNFYKKNLPNIVNGRLDEVCQRIFDFDYQDGTKSTRKETVDVLKIGSENIKKQKSKIRSLNSELSDYYMSIDVLKKEKEALDEEIVTLKEQHDEKERELESEKEKIDALKKNVNEDKKKIKAEQDRLKNEKKALSERQRTWLEEQQKQLKITLNNELAKMKQSLSEYKKKWTAQYKNKLDAEFQALQDMLEAQNKIKLEKALSNQVKDVEKFYKWQSNQRAKQATFGIDFSDADFENEYF